MPYKDNRSDFYNLNFINIVLNRVPTVIIDYEMTDCDIIKTRWKFQLMPTDVSANTEQMNCFPLNLRICRSITMSLTNWTCKWVRENPALIYLLCIDAIRLSESIWIYEDIVIWCHQCQFDEVIFIIIVEMCLLDKHVMHFNA